MGEKVIIKFYFIPSFLYFLLERWLNSMSRNGLQLVRYRGCIYYFKEVKPDDRIYFVYNCTGYRKGDGKYSVSLRYPCIEKQYAVSRKHSRLNEANKTILNSKKIIEIDKKKIDVGFGDIVHERNKIYFKKCFRDVLIFFIALLSCVWVLFNG